VHDLLVVHQHAVRHRVVVADDRVHQLVHEPVSVEAEFLYAQGTNAPRNPAPGMSACFPSHAVNRAAMPFACGMPPTPGGRSITRLLSTIANCPSRKNASRGSVAIQFGLPRPH